MDTILDDLYDHEGFAARRLPDGTLTGTWTKATATFDAYVAACGCGWRGDDDQPPTEKGHEAALDAWEAPMPGRCSPARSRTVSPN